MTQNTDSNILFEIHGDKAFLFINRPPVNILDIATMEDMNEAILSLKDNTDVKVLVLTRVRKVIISMKVGGVYDGSDVVNTTIRPLDAAKALGGVVGANTGRIIFNLGLIGMTCGAISTHMVVCGFTFCEMFDG